MVIEEKYWRDSGQAIEPGSSRFQHGGGEMKALATRDASIEVCEKS
jgi:hypothetical protein